MWKDKLLALSKNGRVVVTASSALSFVGGATTAHILTKKYLLTRIEKQLQEELEKEIEETRNFYSSMIQKEVSGPEEVLKERHEMSSDEALETLRAKLMGEGYTEKDLIETPDPVEQVIVEKNIFEAGEIEAHDPFYDERIEHEKRERDEIWVMSRSEYDANEEEFEKITVFYYTEDGGLLDEFDSIIEDTRISIGDDATNRFGHGSGNNDIVYICNPGSQTIFEVRKAKGSAEEALFGPSLKHANSRKEYRFRGDDE